MVITANTLLLCYRGAPQVFYRRWRSFQTAAQLLPSNSFTGQIFRAFSSSAKVSEGSSIAAGCSSSKSPFFGPHLFIPSKIYTTIIDSNDDEKTEINDNDNHNGDDDDDGYFHMLSLAKNKLVKTQKKLGKSWESDLLFPKDAVCIGASNGWLAFFNLRDGGSIFLVNPFTSNNNNNNSKNFPVVPFLSLPSVETLPFMETLRTSSGNSSSSSTPFPEYFGLNHRNPKTCLQKLVLSSVPSVPIYPFNSKQKNQDQEDDCIAVVIGGDNNELACCRVGETSWFGFGGGETTKLGPYTDIIYSSKEGLFYALKGGEFYFPKDGRFRLMKGPDRDVELEEMVGDIPRSTNPPSMPPVIEFAYHRAFNFRGLEGAISVEAWDLSSRGPSSPEKKILIQASLPRDISGPQFCHKRMYLVESCLVGGQLFLVDRLVTNYVDEDTKEPYSPIEEGKEFENEDTSGRVRERHTYATRRIYVFKLNSQRNAWEPVKCLGDQALFIGLNHSISLSTTEYPMLKKNSIYFCDDDIDEMVKSDKFGGHDIGVYDLEQGKVGSFLCTDVKKFQQPPVWILPNPL
ncbi:hypothetical protein ACH5RR_002597 [Cinchona calisaya]|uniref:KIB1-4 beta-propeller domain-containing protein n=1 Tax=Cinchona calisaya TaxID=153742 RepID=A0ABD3ASF8_9GENT